MLNIRVSIRKKRFSEDGKYVEEDDFVEGEHGQFPLIVKENGGTLLSI